MDKIITGVIPQNWLKSPIMHKTDVPWHHGSGDYTGY